MTKRESSGCCLDFGILKLNIFSSLVLVIWCLSAASCKPPLPVYFDKPIGTQVQGFDTAICGNYLPLDEMVDSGLKVFTEKFDVKYDMIVPKGTTLFSVDANGQTVNYEDIKNILGTHNDPGNPGDIKNCDSLFSSFCSFNALFVSKMTSAIDKPDAPKPRASMLNIAYDRVAYVSMDSLGHNTRDTLIFLGPEVLLTRYAEKYFLNFQSEYGWEILQLELWEGKFLSARPFYFTGYDNCSKNVAALTSSTKNIYPGLKAILNNEKKVIGFKASLDPKTLLEKFKASEESVLMVKLK